MSKTRTMEMSTGLLRHTLRIESPVDTQDAHGQPITTWLQVGTTRAEVRATSGGEFVRGSQIEAGVTSLVTLRYRSDIRPQMRFLTCDGRELNIVRAADVDGRRRWLTCQCKEVVS